VTLRIAHISDPHFGTERPQVVDALRRCLGRLAPELVILSGDITQRARRRQFSAAAAFTASLAPLPVMVVPGNHDIPLFNLLARLRWPYRGYRRAFGETLAPDLHRDGVRFFGFTSAPWWRHKHGELDAHAAEQRLVTDVTNSRIRVAVLHHPLDCRLREDEVNLVRPAARLMEAFARQRVDLVVGGHIHDPHVALSTSRYPRLPRPVLLAVAGTCVSSRTRPEVPNSFNLITLELGPPSTQCVERWDMGAIGEFAPITRSAFVRESKSGWRPRP
jgi:3',5'-cyclic AMP phosphodiesterase CpdA